MKQNLKEEISELIKEFQSSTRTKLSISLSVVFSILLSFVVHRDVLIVAVSSYILIVIILSCIYVWQVKKTISTYNFLKGQTEEKTVLRYPILRPYYAVSSAFVCVSILATISWLPPLYQPFVHFTQGTPTPTPTQTFTPTLTLTPAPTFTRTLTPSLTIPPPAAISDYYMIVLDASEKMQESFDGRTKWDAAQESIEIILEGLNSKSNYGLIVVGGSQSASPADLCGKPSKPAIDFSSKGDVEAEIGRLGYAGGGSFFNGYVLAKRQLEDLPADTVKTLIYITGSSDSCEARDEWSDLKKLLSLPNAPALYSEIIIIDEDGLKARTIAEQINTLSEKVKVYTPQTNEELLDTVSQEVVQTVQERVSQPEVPAAEAPTEQPQPTPLPPPTITPSATATPVPVNTTLPTLLPTTAIPATAVPSNTSSPIPTTQIPPTRTATQTSVVCESTRQDISTVNYEGLITMNAPLPCSSTHLPGTPIVTSGNYSGITQGTVIWVFVYPPNGPYYPQSPNACSGNVSPPPTQSAGTWEVPSYLGSPNDPPKPFDIVVVLVDQAGSQQIGQRLHEDCVNDVYDGISAADLAQMNIDEKSFITVWTR